MTALSNFFNKFDISYSKESQNVFIEGSLRTKIYRDDSEIFNFFEGMADVCRTGSRWVCSDLFNIQREYNTEVTLRPHFNPTIYKKPTEIKLSQQLIHKIIRVIIGLIVAIPGEIAGSCFMVLAYLNKSIRAKHSTENIPECYVPKPYTFPVVQSTTVKGPIKGWAVLEVVFADKSTGGRFPIHIETGEIYNEDPKWLIRMKGLHLIVGSPIVAMVRLIYSIAATALNLVILIPIKILEGKISLKTAALQIARLIENIFRLIVYELILELAAVCTVFLPYTGRQLYGRMERLINNDKAGMNSSKFYLAPCFQRLGLYKSGSPEPMDGPVRYRLYRQVPNDRRIN